MRKWNEVFATIFLVSATGNLNHTRFETINEHVVKREVTIRGVWGCGRTLSEVELDQVVLIN